MASHILVAAIVCAAACEPVTIRVWDADSFRLGLTPAAEAIRIAEIDAPEISEPACPQEALAAVTAKERLADLLDDGPITITRHGSDRYGRTLATVTVDGVDVGALLVTEGLALEYIPGERRERAIAEWCP